MRRCRADGRWRMADGGDGVGVAISEAAHCHQRSRHQRSAIYNRARMSDRTERALAPEPREPSRRRFMIAGEHVILRALKSRYPIAFQNETEWLESAIHLSDAERHFAIERRDDRTHIGNASIHDIDWVSRTAAFGLFIGEPSAWNRGFGSDAIATLVRFAFEEMNLRKLHINVFDYNDRAKHVLETHGFVQEGRLQKEFYREGAYHDIVILSIFRDAEEKSE